MHNYSEDGVPIVPVGHHKQKLGYQTAASGHVPSIQATLLDLPPESEWTEVDLTSEPWVVPDQNRGGDASGVAYAVAYAIEILCRQAGGKQTAPHGSFLYALSNQGKDAGALVEIVLEKAAKESPDSVRWFPAACTGFADIGGALQLRAPVVFGLHVGNSFATTGSDGLVKRQDTTHGIAALLAVGTTKIKGDWHLKCMLTWGPGFGDKGFVYLHKSLVQRPVGAYALMIAKEEPAFLQSGFKEISVPRVPGPPLITDPGLDPEVEIAQIAADNTARGPLPEGVTPVPGMPGWVQTDDPAVFLEAISSLKMPEEPDLKKIFTPTLVESTEELDELVPLDGSPVKILDEPIKTIEGVEVKLNDPAPEAVLENPVPDPVPTVDAIKTRVEEIRAEAQSAPPAPVLPAPPAKPQKGGKPKEKTNG